MNFICIFFFFLAFSPVIYGIIWPCQHDLNCSFLSANATCSTGGNCKCPPGQVYSVDKISCLNSLLYGDKCEENIQCSLMPTGASCREGVCQCNEGYTYVRGYCRKQNGLGKECKEDLDCWFGYDRESVTCANNICTCALGYYKRHRTICRRKSSANGPCIVDEDCTNGKCKDNQCAAADSEQKTLKDNSVQISLSSLTLLTKIDTIKSKNCNSINSNNENKIEVGVTNPYNQTSQESQKFGDNCINNKKPCEGLEHSICVENVCYCKQGYFPHPDTKICMAELGEPATEATCQNNTEIALICGLCVCEKNFFCESNLRKCKKAVLAYGPCTSDSQCSPFAQYCSTERPKKCHCPSYTTFDVTKQLCIDKKGLEGPCEISCPVENSICSEDKICKCNDKYHPTGEGKCLPGIGANCTIDKDCDVENVECSAGKLNENDVKVCACKQNFVQVNENCLKKAENIEDECVNTEQCKPLLANCEENKCICKENEHFSHGRCEEKKNIGEKCKNEAQCFMANNRDSVECKNSYCRCKQSYQTDSSTGTCIKPKSNSSGRPSALKIITFLLFGSAFLVTSAALKQAYY